MRALTEEEKFRVQQIFDGNEEITALTNSVELHQFAWNYNWGDDNWVYLNWIVRNPLCDKGTALLLYWKHVPRWYYGKYGRWERERKSDRTQFYAEWADFRKNYSQAFAKREEFEKYYGKEYVKKPYDLLKEIEEKYLDGFYTLQNISFDPTNDNGYNWTNDYNDMELKQEIPAEMKIASPGSVPIREYFQT